MSFLYKELTDSQICGIPTAFCCKCGELWSFSTGSRSADADCHLDLLVPLALVLVLTSLPLGPESGLWSLSVSLALVLATPAATTAIAAASKALDNYNFVLQFMISETNVNLVHRSGSLYFQLDKYEQLHLTADQNRESVNILLLCKQLLKQINMMQSLRVPWSLQGCLWWFLDRFGPSKRA